MDAAALRQVGAQRPLGQQIGEPWRQAGTRDARRNPQLARRREIGLALHRTPRIGRVTLVEGEQRRVVRQERQRADGPCAQQYRERFWSRAAPVVVFGLSSRLVDAPERRIGPCLRARHARPAPGRAESASVQDPAPWRTPGRSTAGDQPCPLQSPKHGSAAAPSGPRGLSARSCARAVRRGAVPGAKTYVITYDDRRIICQGRYFCRSTGKPQRTEAENVSAKNGAQARLLGAP